MDKNISLEGDPRDEQDQRRIPARSIGITFAVLGLLALGFVAAQLVTVG